MPHGPDWWSWQFLLTAHAQFRMEERELNEIELRRLLEGPGRLEPDPDHRSGRWRLQGRAGRAGWTVVLEPDPDSRTVLVITIFRTDP